MNDLVNALVELERLWPVGFNDRVFIDDYIYVHDVVNKELFEDMCVHYGIQYSGEYAFDLEDKYKLAQALQDRWFYDDC